MTLGFIVDTLSCIGDIQHHIVLILMDLERDRSFSGNGIYCILEQVLNDPLDERRIEIDLTRDSLQAIIINRDAATYARTHVGYCIFHDRNEVHLLQVRFRTYLLETIRYHLQTFDIAFHLRHVFIVRVGFCEQLLPCIERRDRCAELVSCLFGQAHP